MNIKRRLLLQSMALASTGVMLPLVPGLAGKARAQNNVFGNPLTIPPEYRGEYADGKRHFDLRLQHGNTSFFPGTVTPTLGINGSYLGPVVRINRAEPTSFRVRNNLVAPSTLHWHGLNIPAAMDGGPHQVILPGQSWNPEFTVFQPAATQWYHSHIHGATGPQVYQGLAGLLLIDDPEQDAVGLPSTYGVDDIPLVIQDRRFGRDGSFVYLSSMHDRMMGMLGDQVMVNGTLSPILRVERRLVRFRILNGSNARIYNLAFSDGREFTQIASDGGFLDAYASLREIRLAPGERAEILVPLDREDKVYLVHKPLPQVSRGGMGMMAMMGGQGGDRPYAIMALHSVAAGGETVSPAIQSATSSPEFRDGAITRQFRLDMAMGPGMMMRRGGGFAINGRSFDMGRIDVVAARDRDEIWIFSNPSPMAHPVHVHNTQFRLLDRNGRPPGPSERGPKDTVLVESGETVRLGMRFERYADESTPYMFHCHILEHEDQGMMGQFVVT